MCWKYTTSERSIVINPSQSHKLVILMKLQSIHHRPQHHYHDHHHHHSPHHYHQDPPQ